MKTKTKNVKKQNFVMAPNDESIEETEPAHTKKKASINGTGKNKIKKSSAAKKHKQSLEKLKDIDPEFYKYLENNDRKLLKFNVDVDDEAERDSENEDGQQIEEDDEDVHNPVDDFEAASDESDFEDENQSDIDDDIDSGKTHSITLKMLRKWEHELGQKKISIETIKKVIHALNSALLSISNEKNVGTVFKVEGAAIFNGVMQLCILHLHPAIKQYLGLVGRTTKKPHKCKKWNKIRTPLRNYFVDLTKLLEHVSSTNILIVMLKHLHQISNLVGSFSMLIKPILKRLVTLWSTSEETVRVISFLCILKIVRGQETTLLNTVLKVMYLSYVRNSKFVSPNTLPGINFMRRSLVEMFAMDLNISYQHVFLYIRQLAIHLRNAMTLKKKDSFQAVYNWQFINSLRLWSELLSATYNKNQLQPLIYPLISIITGVIKLIPTAQYFPLRFHCIDMLIHISNETRCFIPVLPFILEVLNSNSFNAKHTKVSMKPLKFTCILRLNKAQLQENGFRDEVIEHVFGQTLKYMAHESYTISYPDLMVPCLFNLKQYMKRCKNRNYNSKIRQLCDKLVENANLIESEKSKINFTLKDTQLINAWETTLCNKGTPLLSFYNNWMKTDVQSKKRQATESDDINEYNLPTIKRKVGENKSKATDGPVDLFPSDDEDDEMLEVEKKPPKKEKKTKPKIVEMPAEEEVSEDEIEDDGVDIVKDLDLNDW